jgi:hypothetical protein
LVAELAKGSSRARLVTSVHLLLALHAINANSRLRGFFGAQEVEIPLLRVTFASPAGQKKWSAKLPFFIAFRAIR